MAEFILYSSETFVVSAWGLIYLIIACLGGVVTNALNLEEDSLQDHTHAHSINDPGHAHHYDDKYFQDHVNDFNHKNNPEIVWLGGYLTNFCRNFGKTRIF